MTFLEALMKEDKEDHLSLFSNQDPESGGYGEQEKLEQSNQIKSKKSAVTKSKKKKKNKTAKLSRKKRRK
jgi:hypothetical protein